MKEVKDRIANVSAEIEYHIEFNDDDMEQSVIDRLILTLEECESSIKRIMDTYDTGKVHREGVNVLIAGRPNTGKSSLLNELLGSDRAIVTDIPGTTRDIIQDYANIKGVFVNLSDSAGIRDTQDIIEKIGIEKSYGAAEKADLILYMADVRSEWNEDDKEFFEKFNDKKILVILNKIDLASEEKVKEGSAVIEKETGRKPVAVSLKSGQGINLLYEKLEELLLPGKLDTKNQTVVTNVRHKNILETAYQYVKDSIRGLKENTPVDLVTIDLNGAVYRLGLLTGETASDDIIDRIFANFCVGK